jgi:soluble lytic murein transglycosylase-like protein
MTGARRTGRMVLLAATLAAVASQSADADQQRDPELRAIVGAAIAEAACFTDSFDAEVWYKMMEPRLRRAVPDQAERVQILKHVFCEATRSDAARLPPGLVMAIIDVESRFNRWAVSSAGAVGLMQVMPFWPEELGMRRHQLTKVPENIKMGTAIFRYYLKRERNDVRKALARYNGSVGRSWYSDMVVNRWTRWNGADDLGLAANQPVVK